MQVAAGGHYTHTALQFGLEKWVTASLPSTAPLAVSTKSFHWLSLQLSMAPNKGPRNIHPRMDASIHHVGLTLCVWPGLNFVPAGTYYHPCLPSVQMETFKLIKRCSLPASTEMNHTIMKFGDH